MAVLIEEHPLPPDTVEPPKVDLTERRGEFSTSTYPTTNPPVTTPPPG